MNPQQLANQALQHHRQGNLAEAERLYRAALKLDSRNAMLLCLLGMAVAQQGRADEALPLLDKGLSLNPQMPDGLFARAQLRLAAGHAGHALADIERAMTLVPANPAMLMVQGNVLNGLGRFEEAVQSFARVLALAPGYVDALNNRANALRQLGRLEEALASYDQALRLKPDYFELLYNRGVLLRQMKRPEAAQANYEAALRLRPDSLDAQMGRARTLGDQGRVEEALTAWRQALQLSPNSVEAANGMAELLYAKGAVEEAFGLFADRVVRVFGPEGTAMPEPSPNPPHRIKHDKEQAAYLGQAGGLCFHRDAGARLAGGALNRIARDEIQQQWKTARPQIIVVDNLLTPEALESLRRFCMASTIWHTNYDAGYLGASPETGFACPLLAQIAEEFPKVLPDVLRAYPLKYLWAFKYDSALSGINIHADFAAVNINFWITPDEANQDPQGGGLVVWDKAAPLDWDFAKYNSDESAMQAFLTQAGARPHTIPYRANRAVIFDSDLFHETDRISFREGYENRRINVTLLYGEREKQAQEGGQGA